MIENHMNKKYYSKMVVMVMDGEGRALNIQGKKKYVQQKTLYYPSHFIIAIWPTPREYVSMMMMMMTTCIFLTIIYLSYFIEGCVALCCFLLRISGQWIIKSSHKIDEKTISLSLLVVFIELSKHRFIFFFLNTLVSLCLVVEVVW